MRDIGYTDRSVKSIPRENLMTQPIREADVPGTAGVIDLSRFILSGARLVTF
jgi:hypothetical protein